MVMNYHNAVRRLWNGLCDIWVLETTVNKNKTTVNKNTGRNDSSEVLWYRGEPCRLSFSTVAYTAEDSVAPMIQQTVKLFISNTVQIPAGSKIVVTQNGKTTAYARSSLPAFYSDHQEVTLVPFEEYA